LGAVTLMPRQTARFWRLGSLWICGYAGARSQAVTPLGDSRLDGAVRVEPGTVGLTPVERGPGVLRGAPGLIV
jgi:hypothetical protein